MKTMRAGHKEISTNQKDLPTIKAQTTQATK